MLPVVGEMKTRVSGRCRQKSGNRPQAVIPSNELQCIGHLVSKDIKRTPGAAVRTQGMKIMRVLNGCQEHGFLLIDSTYVEDVVVAKPGGYLPTTKCR